MGLERSPDEETTLADSTENLVKSVLLTYEDTPYPRLVRLAKKIDTTNKTIQDETLLPRRIVGVMQIVHVLVVESTMPTTRLKMPPSLLLVLDLDLSNQGKAKPSLHQPAKLSEPSKHALFAGSLERAVVLGQVDASANL